MQGSLGLLVLLTPLVSSFSVPAAWNAHGPPTRVAQFSSSSLCSSVGEGVASLAFGGARVVSGAPSLRMQSAPSVRMQIPDSFNPAEWSRKSGGVSVCPREREFVFGWGVEGDQLEAWTRVCAATQRKLGHSEDPPYTIHAFCARDTLLQCSVKLIGAELLFTCKYNLVPRKRPGCTVASLQASTPPRLMYGTN